MIEYNYTKNGRIQFFKHDDNNSSTNGFVKSEDQQSLINSGVSVAPYIEPIKTLEQLQQEALAAINSIVFTECQSGAGKLYFSSLDSAARHSSELVQPDDEIRNRAIQLLKWDVAIDAYCDTVLFNIEQGGEVPTLESFIAGLPKL